MRKKEADSPTDTKRAAGPTVPFSRNIKVLFVSLKIGEKVEKYLLSYQNTSTKLKFL
jgi:hypothetical protein